MLKALGRFAVSGARYGFDLILPPVCVACAAPIFDHNLVCPTCWSEIDRISPPVCDRLGLPMPGVQGQGPHISLQALAEPPVFDRARAATVYAGVISRLIVRFKFEDRHEPLPLFLRLMADGGRDLIADADLLVPVPLHRLRLLQRRFNQSALLAQGLARKTGVATALTILSKVKRTKAQAGLDRNARAENVKGAFAVTARGKKLIPGKNVLLIDDVMTTGATANACARVLKAAGAARVDVLTLASTLPG